MRRRINYGPLLGAMLVLAVWVVVYVVVMAG